MTNEERRVAEPLVGKAIAEAVTVFPEDWFRAWAARWQAGDEEARSSAETIRKLVPQVHVDPIPSSGQRGDPFLQTLAAYARAAGHDPGKWMEPDTWLALARRVRMEHPDTVPDESATRAAGARAAEDAAWAAHWWHDGFASAETIRHMVASARMWVVEARERVSGR
jgi:hypothetical protein